MKERRRSTFSLFSERSCAVAANTATEDAIWSSRVEERDGRSSQRDRRTRWSAWSEHDKRIDDDDDCSTLKDEANDANLIQTPDSGAYVVAAGSSFSRTDKKRTHRIKNRWSGFNEQLHRHF